MKKIYLIRHGESEGNVANVYQSYDSPLTKAGREQAKYVAERVASLPIDIVLSSPQPRAKETAEIISKRINKPIELSDLFTERRKPAELNGRSYDDPEARKLALEWGLSLHTSGVKAKDGENFDEIIKRGFDTLDFLAKRPEENILIATHGFFMRTLAACVLLGKEVTAPAYAQFEPKLKTKNTGISIFVYDENVPGLPWYILAWNDHAHLAEPNQK